MPTVVVCLAALLAWSCAAGAADAQDQPLSVTIGGRPVTFGIDFSFAGVYDRALWESMGRERQIKPAFLNLSVVGSVNDCLSYVVVINPVQDGPVPRPYVPGPNDPRSYFFPNQPDGLGVSSDPEGLYKVDDYKFSAFNPIIQEGMLRVGYIDLHSRAHAGERRFGVLLGRAYVPQGFGLDDVTWYTAKDLTHIQRIDAQTDNGVFLHMTDRRLSVNLVGVTGNANPYHDYGYFDFTDPTEDKNSAVAFVGSARWTGGRYALGVLVPQERRQQPHRGYGQRPAEQAQRQRRRRLGFGQAGRRGPGVRGIRAIHVGPRRDVGGGSAGSARRLAGDQAGLLRGRRGHVPRDAARAVEGVGHIRAAVAQRRSRRVGGGQPPVRGPAR